MEPEQEHGKGKQLCYSQQAFTACLQRVVFSRNKFKENMSARRLFRFFRISILLTILVIVAGSTWLTKLRTTDWDSPLWVAIYPINADGSEATHRYIQTLGKSSFATIEQFFSDEAAGWEVPIRKPVSIQVAPAIDDLPPRAPNGQNILSIMWWSLKLRYWAFSRDTYNGPAAPDIKMFVVYHRPRREPLDHSVGLEKGLLGIANVFAGSAYSEKNNVIIAHEILHTVGATDKYDADTLPLFPDGYAEPDRDPRHPQRYAEIMGGRVPVSASRAIIPASLHRCVVGEKTAEEINWITPL